MGKDAQHSLNLGFFLFLFRNMGIIFCITSEISFTIISLSSSDKFFLEFWFSSWNCYCITNYHWNLLRFTLYILEELCFMVHTFIIQILGFQELFFSSS